MGRDPVAIPGPLQLGHKAPPTHAARVFHPRSVSSPNPTPYSPDPLLPSFKSPLQRRSSFSSSLEASPHLEAGRRNGHARSKSSTLPSIRSLKERFQQSFGNTFGRKGPKVVKGDEVKRLTSNGTRVSGPFGGGPGLKGFSGPAGSANAVAGINRSSSLPAKLHALRREDAPPSLPQLVFSADNVDEFGARQSVDQALAQDLPSPASYYTPRPTSPTRSPQYRDSVSPSFRASPHPGRPIVIAPRSASPLPSPFQRNATSPFPSSYPRNTASPHASPYSQASLRGPYFPPVSPAAPLSAPIQQRVLSPIPPPGRRILDRVSQDFARRPNDPPLSSLRKQQAAERESVTRSLSRQGHRNSRILPGATLPSEVADLALVRSQSVGASAQLAPPLSHGSAGVATRASWQVNGFGSEAARRIPGLLQRRHSVSPLVTPKLAQQADDDERDISPDGHGESPPLEPERREEQRGRSLSALLGRASTGLGFASPVGDAHGEKRRPSKPFPPEFEEVPIQRVVVQQPSNEDYTVSSAASASPLGPLPFAPYPPGDAAGKVFPDTPPSSARRTSSNPFVSPFEHRANTPSSYSGASGGAPPSQPLPRPPPDVRPPSLDSLFLPSTQEVRKARSSSSLTSADQQADQPTRVSSLTPAPPLQRDEAVESETASERVPRRAELGAPRAESENYAAQMHAVLAAEERSEKVDIDAVVAESERALGEDERGQRVGQEARSPNGRSPAQALEGRYEGNSPDSPLQELMNELRSGQTEAEGVDDDEDGMSTREEHDDFDDSPVIGRHAAPDRSFRNVSFASSPGGEYPFPLAGYLDSSPAASPSIGRTGLRPHSGPSYSPAARLGSSITPPPLSRSRSSPANPYAARAGSPSPLPAFTPHSPPPPRGNEGDSSLTFDQMEREIVRMEAELALAGRPQSLYEAGPTDEPLATPIKAADDERANPSSPSPAGSPLVGFSPATAPPGDIVTPRTARKWSILEIEKAYERMKRLLGSSARGAPAGTRYTPSEAESGADDGASFANVDVETVLDKALEQARGFTGRAGDDDELEVLDGASEPEAEDETLTLAPPVDASPDPHSPRRPSDSSFDSAHFDYKPLPGIPPPTPSPVSELPAGAVEPHPPVLTGSDEDEVETRLADEQEGGDDVARPIDGAAADDTEPEEQSAAPESPASSRPAALEQLDEAGVPETADKEDAAPSEEVPGSAIGAFDGADSRDGLAKTLDDAGPSTPPVERDEVIREKHEPTALDDFGRSREDSSVDEALGESLHRNTSNSKFVPDTTSPSPSLSVGRTRKASDAGSASGMRRLVLPSANHLRGKGTRDSLLSVISLDDMLSNAGGDEQATANDPERGITTPPTSPTQRTLQTIARSSPSRLSFGGPLRSGIGRELQRRAGVEDAYGDGESYDVDLFDPATRSRRISIHRLLEPTSPRGPLRRRSVVPTGGSDASTWYPQTPSRQQDRGIRPHEGSGEGEADSEAGGAMEKAVAVANIRNMDKLEIFFQYTAVKADKEKAELERDALIDALRETRTTLADIRRQRDVLDVELKREREFVKQVKEHLGGDPERHADRLEALVEGRQTWEHRAQEALDVLARTQDELDLFRRAAHEGREREELLERENVMISARLAAAEMALDSRAERQQLAPVAAPAQSHSRDLHSSLQAHANGLTGSFASTGPPSSYDTASAGSPTLTMSRSTSSATARPSDRYPADSESDDALSSLPDFTIGRGPKDSVGSTASTASLDGAGGFLSLADVAGSPIMGQTLRFGHAGPPGEGSKSSYGSSLDPNGSPTTRAFGMPELAPVSAAREYVSSQSGHTTFRLPFAPAAARAAGSQLGSPAMATSIHAAGVRAASKLSHASHTSYGGGGAEDSEYADRSFDTTSSCEPESDLEGADADARLRERDEAFLRDLTEEIEDVPAPDGGAEERRGRKVSMR